MRAGGTSASGNEVTRQVPGPLLEELRRGRWIPIIGAGFSKNAVVQSGALPPDWRELGKTLGSAVPNHEYDNPVDALSAYEQAFGRPALIQAVSSSLRIQDARPGNAHMAFARLGFERVVTTNFDMLLERAYDAVKRPCLPLIEEVQLSGDNPYIGPSLLKLHGDVHHPQRMIVTEDDYDNFLRRHPLLVTHLAAHLIDHTAVLIGYSLDDPDMRQILNLLRERLGRLARPLWTILVDAPQHAVARFERRGVHVVNLKRRRGQLYGDVLESLFTELRDYWQKELIERSQSTEERTLADLRLPAESSNICYFAVPIDLLPWYRETVFPLVEAAGLVPVAARDVLTPEGTTSAKIDALISRAPAVVVELGTPNQYYEAGLAMSMRGGKHILLVSPEKAGLNLPFTGYQVLVRPDDLTSNAEPFVRAFTQWLATTGNEARWQHGSNEAQRLLALGEYRAAVVAAVAMLERELYARLESDSSGRRHSSLSRLVQEAMAHGLLNDASFEALMNALKIRNEALHLARHVTEREAREAIRAIEVALRTLIG